MSANSSELPVDPRASAERAAPIAVDVRRLPSTSRLAADYAYRFDGVAPFFAGDPREPAAWSDAIRRRQGHPNTNPQTAAIVHAQQTRRGAPAPARAAAERLRDPKTVAIVTGQQAGLFGGPLYTLLKALSAIRLAERVSKEHDTPTVAIFWVEAEDHDWNEVRSATLFDEALTPRTIALPPRTGDPVPVASIALDDAVHAALDEATAILPPTEFREALLADLRAAYAPGVGMAEAFACWLERTLGPRGLIVYDASDPAAKPLASRIFAHELSMPGETVRRAAAAGAHLVEGGYHAQVTSDQPGLALFHLGRGRHSIQLQNGHFVVGNEEFVPAALVEQAATTPAAFSPNVLLRPIVQDAIFPTICYVAGPSELAYLGQLAGVYQHFDVPMPLIFPRGSATLVDSAALRFLTKYNVSVESLQAKDDSTLNQLLAQQIPPSVDQSFAGARAAITEQLERLVDCLPLIDASLAGAARNTLGKMQHDLDSLHGKMIQAAKRRDETLRRQFQRTRALTFPDGHPQERHIAFVWFLNQYGPALIDRLADAVPLDLGHHWVVTI